MKSRNENRLDREIMDNETKSQEGSTEIVQLQEISHLLITSTQKLPIKAPTGSGHNTLRAIFESLPIHYYKQTFYGDSTHVDPIHLSKAKP